MQIVYWVGFVIEVFVIDVFLGSSSYCFKLYIKEFIGL